MCRYELNLNNRVFEYVYETAGIVWLYGYAKMIFHFTFGEFKNSGNRI